MVLSEVADLLLSKSSPLRRKGGIWLCKVARQLHYEYPCF